MKISIRQPVEIVVSSKETANQLMKRLKDIMECI